MSTYFVANNFACLVLKEAEVGEIIQLVREQIRLDLVQLPTAPATLSRRHGEAWHFGAR